MDAPWSIRTLQMSLEDTNQATERQRKNARREGRREEWKEETRKRPCTYHFLFAFGLASRVPTEKAASLAGTRTA